MRIPAGLIIRGRFSAHGTRSRLIVTALALIFAACSVAQADPGPASSGGPSSTALASSSDPASPTQPQGPPLAGRIEVNPSSVLLTARGETAHLVAAATGAD